ncbi:zinc carboxypeptidase [Nonomuraea polychroma]|uniref:Zinc carboxypeptidase n=1 Tax=Nonomuraea polychroma TaxID=46176 RepID=A0A438MHE8_9ACTN|nr:M14 family zinc carboxypeptidase [Nonomuraea polychroma]RVX44998.1 zinc carboxypeptidase [Nonomuraea polychroma]
MLRKRRAAVVLATVLGLTIWGTATASADRTTPGGPWIQDAQQVSLQRLHTYDELTTALQHLEQRSKGAIDVESIGKTHERRDIWTATVGTGPTKVLYITQQHGNEPLGTEAALQLLERIGASQATWATDVLDDVTLRVVVRANPDGTERFQRQNVDPDCSGAFCAPGVGFDINRYHDPAMSPEANPVPEAAAIQRMVRSWRPDITVDYHHQGSYRQPDGSLDTTSVLWPTNPGVAPQVVADSKRVAAVVHTSLQQYGFANVSLYPGDSLPGIARNSFGLQGSASLLIELRGGIGQKSGGYLIRTAYASMAALLQAAADGSLAAVDPAVADTIPRRGEPIDQDDEE